MAFYVTRSGNSVGLSGRFNASAIYYILGALNDALERGYEDYVLDFSACETALNGSPAGSVNASKAAGLEPRARYPSVSFSRMRFTCAGRPSSHPTRERA